MIVCSHCHHQNPDLSSQCEICRAELQSTPDCPSCGLSHLQEAQFCGHCGAILKHVALERKLVKAGEKTIDLPDPPSPDPIIDIDRVNVSIRPYCSMTAMPSHLSTPSSLQSKLSALKLHLGTTQTTTIRPAALVHQDPHFKIQLDQYESPIHIGKPNRQIVPDINLAAFQHSEIVSRIHADILIEQHQYFIRDNGSANGTFVNNQRIRPGHLQALASGDTISLGQGDLVTFTFELS